MERAIVLNWTDERLNRLFPATTKSFGVVILLVGRLLYVTITTVCMNSPTISNGKYTFGCGCTPMITKYAPL